MTADEFTEHLRREGFNEITEVEREPHGMMDRHAHPFESKALILAGEILLIVDGYEHTYRPGDVFHLQYGQEHIERYGPLGVRYLVGRR